MWSDGNWALSVVENMGSGEMRFSPQGKIPAVIWTLGRLSDTEGMAPERLQSTMLIQNLRISTFF